MFQRWREGLRPALLFAMLSSITIAGCSREKLDEIVEKGKKQIDEGVKQAQDSVQQSVDKAKQDATTAAGAAQEKLQLAGSISLGPDGAFKTAGCYGKFVAPVAGRPGALRIQSYRDGAWEAFPSALIQASVTAKQPSELVGQTIPAQMYTQAQSGGPVWFATGAAPVQLKVVSVDGGKLVVEIVGGTLTHSEGGAAVQAVGKVEGALQ